MKRFHIPRLQRKQKGTFGNYFQIYFTSLEHFCLFQAGGIKQNFCILIKIKPKRLKITPGFSKCFWKQTRTKGFGQKFSSTD